MADEYNRPASVGPNWWDLPSSRTSAPSISATTSSSSSSSTLNPNAASSGGCYGWLQGGSVDATAGVIVNLARSSTMDNAVAGSGPGSLDYANNQVQIMGLGLSPIDWNQQAAAFLSEKGGDIGGGFRSLLQEGMGGSTPTNFQHHQQQQEPISGCGMLFGSQWNKPSLSPSSEKLFPPVGSTGANINTNTDPHEEEFKPNIISSRGFSLDHHHHHHQFSSNFHHNPSLDSSVSSNNSIFEGHMNVHQAGGLMGSNQHQQQQQQQQQEQQYPNVQSGNFDDIGSLQSENLLASSSNWSNVPQFLRNSASTATAADHHNKNSHQLLHLSNNIPFWNSSSNNMAADHHHHHHSRPPQSSFFPNSLMQSQVTAMPTCFEEKPVKHNAMEVREIGANTLKKGGASQTTSTSTNNKSTTTTSSNTTKRSRSEASSTMPPFKVRKEKMGDRITALQQLVSPFGKTDTASVLSEAIEYIKFLHEQIHLLSTPYLKSSGSSLQHQQMQGSTDHEQSSKDPEGPRHDLRSRGLCLVPVSSTFPVAHETSVDFWTPTFGGTFR